MAYHSNATGNELHIPFIESSGDPEGSVTADKGKFSIDTTTNNIYRKTTSSGNTGWNLLLVENKTDLYYGIEWNQNTDAYSRLGISAGQSVQETIDDHFLPLHAEITAGLLDSSGNFTEFNPDNWNEDVDGNSVSKDGSSGNVMVKYPKMYIKREYNSGVYKLKVSRYNLAGYDVHPWFIKQGQEVDYRYLGAYKSCLYDVSEGNYIGGQGAAGINTAEDKLSSASGTYPHTNEKRSEYRTAATNNGNDWCQQYYWARDYINLMFVIEYGDFNIQNYYIGITDVNGGDWDTYNGKYAITQCGVTDSVASGTGEKSVTIDAFPSSGSSITVKPMRWRGLENPFGHLWEFVDGFNTYNVEASSASFAYLCKNQDNFADDTTTNYTNEGELPQSDDYITDIRNDGILLPSSVGGNSGTYLADYFYTYYDNLSGGYGTDWRIAHVGGDAVDGGRAGLSGWYVANGSGHDDPFVGGRLCF